MPSFVDWLPERRRDERLREDEEEPNPMYTLRGTLQDAQARGEAVGTFQYFRPGAA